jgi:CBS domain-containing protein
VSTVRDIMTRLIVKIDREKLVCEVEGLFISKKISAAPLVDASGKIAGLVTKSDINRFHFNNGDPYYTPVWEIASPVVATIDVSASIKDAATLMLERHVHHLLVVNDDNMAGILSSFDFVRLVAGRTGT